MMKRLYIILFLTISSIYVSGAQQIVRFQDELSGLYGYKQQGKVIIEANFFNGAKEFSEGLAAVEIGKRDIMKPETYYNWGYIDQTGTVVIPPQFFEARNFSEGLAAVNTRGEGWKYVNHNNELIVIERPVSFLGDFTDGLAPFMIKGHMWGFVDKDGKIVIQPIYRNVYAFEQGFALVKVDSHLGTYVYVNMKGEEVSKYANDLSEAKKLLKLYKKTEKGKAYLQWYDKAYNSNNID